MLAFGGHGEPIGPMGCFIGATVCLYAACSILIRALHPRWRGRARWGKRGQGAPISLIGSLICVVNALLWGVALVALGLEYPPIASRTGWLLGGGFVALMAAAIRDDIHHRQV